MVCAVKSPAARAAESLKAVLKQQGVSQERVGQIIGCTQPVVSRKLDPARSEEFKLGEVVRLSESLGIVFAINPTGSIQ